MPAPPDTVALPAAVLTRLRAADGPALRTAVHESLEHLGPWMGWATPGAADGDAQLGFARAAEASWDAGTEHLYLLRERVGAPVLGSFGLHHRLGPGAVEVGYWLHPAATGRGHARAATRALVGVGLALPGVERVEVHVDVANVRSSGVARAAGLRLDRVVPRSPESPAQVGRVEIWVARAEEGGAVTGAGPAR
ncbi:GNAT family N-acetyltransferase [Rhodococcus aerolatus]